MKTMIKNVKIKGLILLVGLGYGVSVQAQNFKVESVKMRLEQIDPNADKELELCVQDIEKAAAHPKTANHPKMWYYKGLTYISIYREGDTALKAAHPNSLQTAAQAFEKVFAVDSKKKYGAKAEGQLLDCAIGYFNIGVNKYNQKNYKGAIADYAKTIEYLVYDKDKLLAKQEINKNRLTEYSYFAAMADENYEQAKGFIKVLIDGGYTKAKVYSDMVRILLHQGDTTEALVYLEQAKEIFDADQNIINTELDIYLKQGRSAELINKLSEAITADPENKIYYFARAVSYERLEESEKAEVDYKKAIELDEYYYDAHYNLGVIFINRCKPVAKKIDDSNKQSEIDALEEEIDRLYTLSIPSFEKALENEDYPTEDRIELAGTLKRIYARLMGNNEMYMSRYQEIKKYIADLESQ
jgi:tetratricopeptide (TPR) repeat protein